MAGCFFKYWGSSDRDDNCNRQVLLAVSMAIVFEQENI